MQTGGGDRGGEIVLNALDAATVERLRELVGRRPAAEGPPPPERALTTRRLLAGALTSGQIAMVLPVLAVAGQVFQDLPGDERDNGEALTAPAPARRRGLGHRRRGAGPARVAAVGARRDRRLRRLPAHA